MKLLEVRNLSFATEGREILHGVDFFVEAGETVVVVGKNGAGKSSIAGAVMGCFDDENLMGKVIFNGEDISALKMDERARKGIFMSYQAPVEVPGINMLEMMRTALEEEAGKPVRRQEVELKIAEGVKRLKMDAFTAGREINVGASGGERKKNEILQMLVLRPKLAILDEIDSGLDVNAAKVVSKVVAEYQEETGAGLLIITHNLRILDSLKVDKVVEIESGKVARIGGAEILEEIGKEGFQK